MQKQSEIDPHSKNLYFDLQADFGITKHMGGLKATRRLAEMCEIGPETNVLEVGCGIGATSCSLAKDYGCELMAVDISEKMVSRTEQRVKQQKLGELVKTRTADAQQLPFEDNTFDAVISESVLAFVPDKPRALAEYARVAKPDGFVGLNEVIWLKPPSPELVAYTALLMAGADFMTVDGCCDLLEGAGLEDFCMSVYTFNAFNQYLEGLRTLNLGEYTRAWYRFITRSVSSPAYRRFASEALRSPRLMFAFTNSIGYGVFAGRK
jgi:arsenite methyltransferase